MPVNCISVVFNLTVKIWTSAKYMIPAYVNILSLKFSLYLN